MKKRIPLVVLSLIFLVFTNAQEKNIKSLRIGDKVPDIQFTELINYPEGTAKLSDFRDKLVILDFWNIACKPCISSFPKMEKLQEKFNGRIQIILVNALNPLNRLKKKGFPKNHPSAFIRDANLPMYFAINEDEEQATNSPISKMFPHSAEPFHVWIDKDGVIRAMTSGENATEKEIEEFLSGKDPNLYLSHDASELYDWVDSTGTKYGPGSNKSFIRSQNDWVLRSILYSSVFTQNLLIAKGIPTALYDSTTGKQIGFRIGRALTLIELFKYALFGNYASEFKNNLVFVKAKNSDSIIGPRTYHETYHDWRRKNAFNYELRLPPSRLTGIWKNGVSKDDTLFRKILLQDIERFFGIRAHVERKIVKCLLLVRTNSLENLKTTGGNSNYELSLHFKNGIQLKNQSLHIFITDFQVANNYPNIPLLVNQTGYDAVNFKVDMDIFVPLYDIPAVKKAILKYGLDFTEDERELKVLVLEEME